MLEVLNTQEMYKADSDTIESGILGVELMENAGFSTAKIIIDNWNPCPLLILCGPGNNGGDGFVIARHLKKAGWPIRVASLVSIDKYKGDAATMAQKWDGAIELLSEKTALTNTALVVDAVFGIGLSKPLGKEIRQLFKKINNNHIIKVIAVDIPSGINGDTSNVDPDTLKADLTVTLCRKKIGHLLLPGKVFCGKVHVVSIGITDKTIANMNTHIFENHPALWLKDYPWPVPEDHKYKRGHTLILGSLDMTGAACMAGHAALRSGSGLMTIATPQESRDIYARYKANFLLKTIKTSKNFKALLNDKRINTVLLGPGAGITSELKEITLDTVSCKEKACILDADAITVFKDNPEELFTVLHDKCVLTPHEKEFERLFGKSNDNKLIRAQNASKKSGAVVVLKGNDTIIAAPDGTTIINTNSPSTLATAGSGDVLSGMIAGLIAQGMPVFQSACAAVWLHGACAKSFGPCLIAEDIADQLPIALSNLLSKGNS